MEAAATAQRQHYYAEYHARETLSPSERHCETDSVIADLV